jgi:hypothetical protein
MTRVDVYGLPSLLPRTDHTLRNPPPFLLVNGYLYSQLHSHQLRCFTNVLYSYLCLPGHSYRRTTGPLSCMLPHILESVVDITFLYGIRLWCSYVRGLDTCWWGG